MAYMALQFYIWQAQNYLLKVIQGYYQYYFLVYITWLYARFLAIGNRICVHAVLG